MPPPIPTSAPEPLGVLLAGGASRRFGTPKAFARVGGRTLAERARDTLGAVLSEIVVLANEGGYDGLRLPVHADDAAGLGPVGGLATALRLAAEAGRAGVIVVGCDMPFIPPALVRALAERARADDVDAVVPESTGRRGMEPLCAWYSVRARALVDAMIRAGDLALHHLPERIRTARIPLGEVRAMGDPARIFFNVNTVDNLQRAEDMERGVPPAVCMVGRKNSGKTTLAVAVLAELRRRGLRVASIKHGHHDFESDQPGRDSWRHFNEGQAEATLMAGTGKIALTMRMEGEPDPRALVGAFFAGRGYDGVLIEGWKHGPFPRIEVFRRAVHERPIHDPAAPDALLLALVTDEALQAAVPVIVMDADPAGAHVARVADLVQSAFGAGGPDGR
ncbi:MAG TPA: molybdopterin-guanine dinucleotide biosynthesis protein B [Longimicrobium sp.]|jgi:molybdopterin-guanine dinucleotide biosynthesis protein MobB|uniref:molybdopterin-guanine dinucleotide biosynthesis protein B n=1 Tax=Longimicrobium sp. TaxID=2029185 RepID=UPI002EDA1524